MKIKITPASKNICRQNLKNHIKVTLDVTDEMENLKKKDECSKPVFLVVALDRSGSMGSPAQKYAGYHRDSLLSSTTTFISSATKLDCAKSSTEELVGILSENDKFALLAFDDCVETIQKPITINDHNKKEIISNIRKIFLGGCTNIEDTLIQAMNFFTESDIEKYNCKIILLSDGEANVGIRTEDEFVTLACKILDKGISTSTIGLGATYDAGVMEGIASHCAGSFNHISDANMIKDIFVSEFKRTQAVVCRNTIFRLYLPDMVMFEPNLNNYKEEITKEYIEIKFGNIYNSKDIFFEFSPIQFMEKDIKIKVVVEYEKDGEITSISKTKKIGFVENSDETVENPEVIKEVLDIINSSFQYSVTKAVATNNAEAVSYSLSKTEAMYNNISCYNSVSQTSIDCFKTDAQSYATSTSSMGSENDFVRSQMAMHSKKLRNSDD